jgi:hypothetical protein
MRMRFVWRKDNPAKRQWFAVLRGTGVKHLAGYEVTRIFFPWFYFDLLFPTLT